MKKQEGWFTCDVSSPKTAAWFRNVLYTRKDVVRTGDE